MGWLTDLLRDYPALSVAKERLALIEDRLKKAEADKAELEKEVKTLREQNADLRGQIVAMTKTSTFEEHQGVYWKRGADGKVQAIAYCPECQLAMQPVKHGSLVDEVKCSKCRFRAPFKTYRVEPIAAELNSK